jgi:hypothetical protein
VKKPTSAFRPWLRLAVALLIIVAGLSGGSYLLNSGHTLTGLCAFAAMLGALKPLYPDESV